MGKIDHFTEAFCLPKYQSRFFHHQKGWERLLDLGERVFFPYNHVIVNPGDEMGCCFLVVSGRVASLEYTEEGAEHLFNMFGEGSLFLESNVLSDYPSAVYFQTLMPTELVRIKAKDLEDAMKKDFELTRFILDSMSFKYYSAMDLVRENYNHDAVWKVFNMFVLLAANIGKPFDSWVMIDMKISQQTIGNMLGLNRITTNKALKELKEMQVLALINGYYCIRAENLGNLTQEKGET